MACHRASSLVSCLGLVLVACGGVAADPERDSQTGADGSDDDSSDASSTPELPECNDHLPQTTGPGTGSGDSTGDPPVGMDDDMPLLTSPEPIQRGEIETGTLVLLEGVVVTTPAAGSELAIGFEQFVQDPAGGPWSGIRVLLVDEDLLDLVQPGDVVDVEGRVTRTGDIPRISISPGQGALIPIGTGVLPIPAVILAEDLLEGTELTRSHEAVPIRVVQPVVTNASLCSGEFEIEDGTRVDDRYAPGGITPPQQGSTLDAVQGVLIHGSDGLELAPRSADEVEGP